MTAFLILGCSQPKEVDAEGLRQAARNYDQDERIEQLEKRIETLEQQNDPI